MFVSLKRKPVTWHST